LPSSVAILIADSPADVSIRGNEIVAQVGLVGGRQLWNPRTTCGALWSAHVSVILIGDFSLFVRFNTITTFLYVHQLSSFHD
jgi:hypothetical protein